MSKNDLQGWSDAIRKQGEQRRRFERQRKEKLEVQMELLRATVGFESRMLRAYKLFYDGTMMASELFAFMEDECRRTLNLTPVGEDE